MSIKHMERLEPVLLTEHSSSCYGNSLGRPAVSYIQNELILMRKSLGIIPRRVEDRCSNKSLTITVHSSTLTVAKRGNASNVHNE